MENKIKVMKNKVKTGLIVRFGKEVQYYGSQNENSLRDLPIIEGKNRRTFKTSDNSIIVENKFNTYIINSDGSLIIKPHSQVLDRTEDIVNAK
jgi:hypothetical protein